MAVQPPPPLKPGNVVRIVAPSSPFDRALFWRGLGVLASRYRLRFRSDICSREGFLAGSDRRRQEELEEALRDPDARAIFAARGGYGLTRLLPALALRDLIDRPKWLVGFSDITALHVACARADLMSLHATNVTGLGRGDARAALELFRALDAPLAARTLVGKSGRSGRVRGRLAGGNLTILHTCAAAGRLRMPPGCILALEDVSESSYQIDRMLEALITSGALDQVAGFALGEFFDCRPGRYQVPVAEVLQRQLDRLGVPYVEDLPFGHDRRNTPLTLGSLAELDGDRGTLKTAACATA